MFLFVLFLLKDSEVSEADPADVLKNLKVDYF